MSTNRSDIERVQDFNRQLLLLHAAGIELDLGAAHRKSLKTIIEPIDQMLRSAADRERSVEQMFATQADIPSRYRAAVFTFLGTGDTALALEGLAAPATARRELGRSLARSFYYPLLILILTYFAFLLLVFSAGPTIERMLADFEPGARGQITWLVLARQWFHWWAVLVPLVVLGLVLGWWLAAGESKWSWVPGARPYYQTLENAHLAERLTTLIQHGCSVDQALSMSGPVDRDPGREDLKTHSLPKLLRWAVTSSANNQPQLPLLQLVAETYRQSAIRKQYRWRVVVPAFTGVAIGGLFVLAYGVSLFGPLYEMLDRIASPEGPL